MKAHDPNELWDKADCEGYQTRMNKVQQRNRKGQDSYSPEEPEVAADRKLILRERGLL